MKYCPKPMAGYWKNNLSLDQHSQGDVGWKMCQFHSKKSCDQQFYCGISTSFTLHLMMNFHYTDDKKINTPKDEDPETPFSGVIV